MTFSRLGESYWHLCTMTDLFLGPCCGHSLPNKSGLEIFHYMFHKYNIYNIFHKYFNPFSPLRRMEWRTLVVDKDKRFKFFKLSASFSKVTGESRWLCFVWCDWYLAQHNWLRADGQSRFLVRAIQGRCKQQIVGKARPCSAWYNLFYWTLRNFLS